MVRSAIQKNPRPVRADLVRSAVLEVYAAVRSEGQLADRALDRVLRRERRLYSQERRAVAESVYGLLRQERRLDFVLFGGAPPPKLGWSELYEARLSALEAGAASAPLPENLPMLDRVGLEGSLPPFLAKMLVEELGEANALELSRALASRAPLTVRANLLKGDRATLAERLSAEGVRSSATRWSPLGLTLEARGNALALQAYEEGRFEIQDEGSQLIALLMEAKPGERVVDACAGAGGKTLALAAAMQNKGELWAFDVDAKRLGELKQRARRAGVHNVRIQALSAEPSGSDPLERLRGKSDRVLVDAPCSGLGTLRRSPDARYRLKPEDFIRFPALQASILVRFAPLVRPGGRLVYATCSLARQENEAVIEEFLASKAPFRAVSIGPLLGQPALAQGPFLRLYPHRHGTDGFFAAVLERTA
jgi:16S rRNA (cytosine967-C5)-methyltransferase